MVDPAAFAIRHALSHAKIAQLRPSSVVENVLQEQFVEIQWKTSCFPGPEIPGTVHPYRALVSCATANSSAASSTSSATTSPKEIVVNLMLQGKGDYFVASQLPVGSYRLNGCLFHVTPSANTDTNAAGGTSTAATSAAGSNARNNKKRKTNNAGPAGTIPGIGLGIGPGIGPGITLGLAIAPGAGVPIMPMLPHSMHIGNNTNNTNTYPRSNALRVSNSSSRLPPIPNNATAMNDAPISPSEMQVVTAFRHMLGSALTTGLHSK
jgi:hypothetical protein